MPSFNQVNLMGNLTRDPELRYTPQGVAVCDLALAVNNKFTKKNGEKVDEVVFVDITCWNKLAENAAEYLKKGRPLFVSGRLAQDRWEEEGTGKKRSKLRVVAESLQFLGTGSKDDAAPEGGATAEEAPAPEAPAPVHSKGTNGAKPSKVQR